MSITAKVLDRQRLNSQRSEAIRIAKINLGLIRDYKYENHPAVKMWKGYAPFLILEYLRCILKEWENRGYKNIKCAADYTILYNLVKNCSVKRPLWLDWEFMKAHQSNLVRKKPEHYRKYYPSIPDNLPYIWPSKR